MKALAAKAAASVSSATASSASVAAPATTGSAAVGSPATAPPPALPSNALTRSSNTGRRTAYGIGFAAVAVIAIGAFGFAEFGLANGHPPQDPAAAPVAGAVPPASSATKAAPPNGSATTSAAAPGQSLGARPGSSGTPSVASARLSEVPHGTGGAGATGATGAPGDPGAPPASTGTGTGTGTVTTGGGGATTPTNPTLTMVAGPGCDMPPSSLAFVDYTWYSGTDSNGTTGWSAQNSGGYGGCQGNYQSMPMSGDGSVTEHASWYFHFSSAISRCDIEVFIPSGSLAEVGGDSADYGYYIGGSSSASGTFSIDQLADEGGWVDYGTVPVSGGEVEVQEYNDGVDYDSSNWNAHDAVAQIEVRCE